MNMRPGPEIRCDDVLQSVHFTSAQLKDLGGRTMFECFLEADKLFAKYNYPMTLAICSEGINFEPEWVQHIKDNIERYNIELHCQWHLNHSQFRRARLKLTLWEAQQAIESVFGQKITTWYPPWGRKGEHPDGPYVCEKLGIQQYKQIGKVDAKLWLKNPDKYPHVNFHAWNDKQVNHVNAILCRLHERN